MSQHQNLFESTRFLYTFVKYLGFLSFKYENEDEKILRLKRWRFLLVIATILHGAVVLYVFSLYYEIFSGLNGDSLLEDIFHVVHNSIECSAFVVNVLRSKINNDEVLRYLNELGAIEEELDQRETTRLHHAKVKIMSVLVFVLYALFLMAIFSLLFYLDMINVGQTFNALTLAIFFFSSELSVVAMFSSVFIIITHLLSRLNRTMIRRLVHERRRNYHDLPEFSRLYRRIFEISRGFRRIYGINVLLQIGVSISIMVLHAYAFLNLRSLKIEKKEIFLVISALILSLYFVMAGICVVLGESYCREVENLKRILYKATNETKSEALRMQINALSLQIFHEDYEITAAGFFVVDMKIVTTITSATIMYIIILIQFNPNSKIFDNLAKSARQ